MAGHKRGTKPEPRSICAGVNADGQTACRYRALAGSTYCARHGSRENVEHAPAIVARYVDSDPSPEQQSPDLKAALAALRSNNSPLVMNAILETLESAGKAMYFDCPCGKRNRVTVPDHGTRLKAAEMAITHSIGKPGNAEAADPGPIDTSLDISRMTIEERTALKKRLLARLGEAA